MLVYTGSVTAGLFTPCHATRVSMPCYKVCAVMPDYTGILIASSPHGMHGVLLCWSTLAL